MIANIRPAKLNSGKPVTTDVMLGDTDGGPATQKKLLRPLSIAFAGAGDRDIKDRVLQSGVARQVWRQFPWTFGRIAGGSQRAFNRCRYTEQADQAHSRFWNTRRR